MNKINIEVNSQDKKWQEKLPNARKVIEKACLQTLKTIGLLEKKISIDVSILLTNDKFIQELNAQYRQKNKPTDVLSFPQEDLIAGKYEQITQDIALGDIILSLDFIEQEAVKESKEFKNHFIHLVVHGMLHLLGYDHEVDEDAKIMEKTEIDILASMSINNPY